MVNNELDLTVSIFQKFPKFFWTRHDSGRAVHYTVTTYLCYLAEEACKVWCHKKGGGFKSRGWSYPDGTVCLMRRAKRPATYCIRGSCKVCFYSSTFNERQQHSFISWCLFRNSHVAEIHQK